MQELVNKQLNRIAEIIVEDTMKNQKTAEAMEEECYKDPDPDCEVCEGGGVEYFAEDDKDVCRCCEV